MPGGNGTGPMGRGQGRGSGRGRLGPVGNCVCPKCKERIPHKRGIPCNTVNCPKCGVKMVRE